MLSKTIFLALLCLLVKSEPDDPICDAEGRCEIPIIGISLSVPDATSFQLRITAEFSRRGPSSKDTSSIDQIFLRFHFGPNATYEANATATYGGSITFEPALCLPLGQNSVYADLFSAVGGVLLGRSAPTPFAVECPGSLSLGLSHSTMLMTAEMVFQVQFHIREVISDLALVISGDSLFSSEFLQYASVFNVSQLTRFGYPKGCYECVQNIIIVRNLGPGRYTMNYAFASPGRPPLEYSRFVVATPPLPMSRLDALVAQRPSQPPVPSFFCQSQRNEMIAFDWSPEAADVSVEDRCPGLSSRPLPPNHHWDPFVQDGIPRLNNTTAVIGFHLYHDASITVAVGGEVLVVLELERLWNKRYEGFTVHNVHQFSDEVVVAMNVIYAHTNISRYDVGAVINPERRPRKELFAVLETHVKAQKWVVVDHHRAHAVMALFDSPFRRALVLSYDAGGNDGSFFIFDASKEGGLKAIQPMKTDEATYNMGEVYNVVAALLPDVAPRNLTLPKILLTNRVLELAGKKMAYEAMGTVQEEWIPIFEALYESPNFAVLLAQQLVHDLENAAVPINVADSERGLFEPQVAKNIAATSQHVFESMVVHFLTVAMEGHELTIADFDGIVVTGGCALNVKVNDLLVRTFGVPVHVPAAPNDCGLTVGAVWAVLPPVGPSYLAYAGLGLFDLHLLQKYVQERDAKSCDSDCLADELAAGAVVGVVRGRQEFGPRALGHRSLLAYPDKIEIKDKMNAIKRRQSYRPVAPCMTAEQTLPLFGRTVESPYMSFAPKFLPEAQQMFPAVTHLDGSARVQTVTRAQNAWLHALLAGVAQRRGHAILANTSFNGPGQPIINRVADALAMMDRQLDVDAVWIEGWLFRARRDTAS